MKILMLCKSLSLGGLESHLVTLCAELKALGHRVWVVSEKIGKEIRELLTELEVPCSEKINPGAVIELIKQQGIDLVHLHPWGKALGARKVCQATGVPLVVTCHGLRNDIIPELMSTASKFICISEAVRQVVLRRNPPPEKCVLIHNPVNTRKFRPALRREEPEVVLFAARLSRDKYKAANRLVDAVAGIKKARLWILGDGSKKSRIRRHKQVALLGPNFHPEEIMAQASIICGESRVIMEAMALGKPALVLGNKGYRGPVTKETLAELERDNFMCLEKTVFDSGKLQKDLAALLKSSRERTRQGQFNRVIAVNRYDAQNITRTILAQYREALAQKEKDAL